MDYIVWLDSEKAQIFGLNTTGIEKSNVKKSGIDHHSHDKKDHTNDSHLEHFYRDVATKINDAVQLLIMGPGVAKSHFKNYLESHHASGLSKKVIGIENSDHPTDNQILATARGFFKTYELFNTPIKVPQ
ncbi:MAG TPA: hypothetical protein VE954_09825 [Oligoflexus sp.]|uniref:hypothetical protein n=1 Tax=Oligoflexus sp. TaxID=1971216 RepID=UPI002D4FE8B3|nr:hypothetical protein [Oligoflexus sp.]HYX33400.1 hypothetical protein [Oligoflexus sp.]